MRGEVLVLVLVVEGMIAVAGESLPLFLLRKDAGVVKLSSISVLKGVLRVESLEKLSSC